jgi:hypothetical protein
LLHLFFEVRALRLARGFAGALGAPEGFRLTGCGSGSPVSLIEIRTRPARPSAAQALRIINISTWRSSRQIPA